MNNIINLNNELKQKIENRWGKQGEINQKEQTSFLELKKIILEKIDNIEKNAIDMERFLLDVKYQESYSKYKKKVLEELFIIVNEVCSQNKLEYFAMTKLLTYIIYDNDETGHRGAMRVATALKNYAENIYKQAN